MSDAMIDAAVDLLDDSLAAVRAAIADAPVEALAWRPPAEDANPLVVLAVHAMHSTRWWLSVATDAPMPERDRPSEFQATAADPDELRSFVEKMSEECRVLLVSTERFDPTATWTSPTDGDVVTRGWALLHALEHLREHAAQALLTRQLWRAHLD
jgi:DinB superfamily